MILSYLKSLSEYMIPFSNQQNPYKGLSIDNSLKFKESSSIKKNTCSSISKNNFFSRDYRTLNELIISYYLYYPEEFYLLYPEFVVHKLGLDKSILETLPKKENRKRKDIRNWMLNSKLTKEQFIEVGF